MVSKQAAQFSRILSAALCICLFLFASPIALAEPVSITDLEKEVAKHRLDIQEFNLIAEEAKARGLRVYLLGGAAASLADHGKANVLAGQNKLKSDPSRLEWELNNILFPEQDVDLVITKANGKPESVAEINDFRDWVRHEFPYEVDGRSRWDVLGLKTDDTIGNKMALKGNPDFLHQNNDSLSLGMLELTKPPKSQSVFSDLGTPGAFLQDAAGDELHFYRNKLHNQTKYFVNGRNPEILSVVRTLEKAARYEKDVDSQGVKAIRQIIKEWAPFSVSPGSYVDNYLNGRGKRIVTHAKNIHQAYELLEVTGLKSKLEDLPNADVSVPESLSWWINKQPLPVDESNAMASGLRATGRTAKDLGITKATHWTSFAGHRLLTWNYDGKPRLFESRNGVAGERAVLGNGFYTYKNYEKNTQYSANNFDSMVTFKVDPQAREGVDFVLEAGNVIVWKNSSALTVEHSPTYYPPSFTCASSFSRFGAASSASANQSLSNASASWPGPSGRLHNSILANQPVANTGRQVNTHTPPVHTQLPGNSFNFARTPDEAVTQILRNPRLHQNIQLEFGAVALAAKLKNQPLQLSELCQVASKHHALGLDNDTGKMLSDMVKADPLLATTVQANALVLRQINHAPFAQQLESYPYLLFSDSNLKILNSAAAKRAKATAKFSTAAGKFWKEHPGLSITGGFGAFFGGLILWDKYERSQQQPDPWDK